MHYVSCASLGGYLSTLFLISNLFSSVATSDLPVVIIGAGTAGTTAAYHLAKLGIDTPVVEATDRVGGRLRQGRIGRNGPLLELGANWIQGFREDDEYSKLATEIMKIANIPDDTDDYYLVRNGTLVPDEEADPIWARFETALNAVYRLKRQSPRLPDMSVTSALDFATGWIASTPEQISVQQAYIDYEYAVPAERVSYLDLSPYFDPDEPEVKNRFVRDIRGFRRFPDWHMIRALRSGRSRLTLRAPVASVSYEASDASGKDIFVVLRNGTRINARAIISTVSLGVLKSAARNGPNALKFIPQLPAPVRLSITKHDMQSYVKLFVRFRTELFKSSDPLYLAPVTCRRDGFASIQNFNKEGYFPGENIVLITAVGPYGRELQCESQDVVIKEALEAVSIAVGRSVLPWEVRDTLMSPFGRNEFFRGMYSGIPVGVTKDDIKNLKSRVGSLFFAGEHTQDPIGYVQSAWLSGKRVAKEVQSYLL